MAKEDLILRDKLAIERTYLAKERTTLAYVRTGIAMIGVGLFTYKFVDMDPFFKYGVTAAMLVPGAFITVYGVYRTMRCRKNRKEFVHGYRCDD